MKKWGSLFAVAALACSSTALADGYAGVNYTNWTYETSDEEVGDLSVRFGGDIAKYWAVELRIGGTVTPHEYDTPEGELSQSSASVMSRFQYPMGLFEPYVAVGYTSAKVTQSISGLEDEEFSFNDPSFALGLDLHILDSLAINAEVGQLMKPFGNEVNGVSVGLAYQFY